MPTEFEILHIIYLAVMVISVAVNAVMGIHGIVALRKKRSLTAELILFSANWTVTLVYLVFALCFTIRYLDPLPFGFDESFAFVYGGNAVLVPVLSELFACTADYILFFVLACVTETAVVFSIIVQMIKWKSATGQGKTESKPSLGFIDAMDGESLDDLLGKKDEPVGVTVTGEKKKLEDEIVESFSVKPTEIIDVAEENECLDAIDPKRIEVGSSKRDRVRVLRGKTYVKGDAAKAYKQYLSEKAAAQCETNE